MNSYTDFSSPVNSQHKREPEDGRTKFLQVEDNHPGIVNAEKSSFEDEKEAKSTPIKRTLRFYCNKSRLVALLKDALGKKELRSPTQKEIVNEESRKHTHRTV